ncbi:hypothetical protein I3842_Q105400 [Carya illinoinensis]|uniref:Uncharacterized protein n=1 Tax=Carya illinoinensis TaxID=32201 RepID=A0A922A2E5_CARIL|nr:hypothetical protein I3842_Q105400 [Carya illinoinensis]
MSKINQISEQSIPKVLELKQLEASQQEDRDELDDQESCRTPNSQDHQIPTIQSCPPTPRKQPRAFVQKRKWNELHFFETTSRDELESFFRTSSFQFPRVASQRPAAPKRRCTSYLHQEQQS